jgi:hypothetical protein
MAKKPSKSKAKQSRAKSRPRMLKEFQLDIFGGRKLAGTRPVPTRAELLASAKRDREFEEYIASDELGQFKAREAAAKARHQERLFRRPVEMQSRSYRLPPDVEAFLSRLHNNPLRFASIDGVHGVSADEAAAMIEAAYLRGCTEGYIEGRVADIEPKRERSRKANAARRQKHNLDERDAEIVEKHRRLRAVPLSASETEFRLAEEYGLSDKMIRIIIGKARKAAR